MKLEVLGYTKKWIEYGLINQDILNRQFSKFLEGKDLNTEHYRYDSFLSWIRKKRDFTDLEIENFIKLAIGDSDQLMAGSAVKELFTCNRMTRNQFELVKKEYSKFGEWTIKEIKREELKRKNMQK